MLKLFHRRYSEIGLIVGLLLLYVPSLMLAASPDQGDLSARGADVAWQLHLPSSKIVHFTSYHLLEGYIYAMGTDGTVAAVRADNGQTAWIRQLADEGDQLWPPASYHSQEGDAIGLTRLHDVLFVDPKNGMPIKTLKASRPNAGPASFSPGRAYLAAAGAHLAAYRLKDEYIRWRASFDATLSIPPLFVPALNIVVAVDDSGLVAGIDNENKPEKRIIFKQNLHARPKGWLAVDGQMLYLSTENQLLHAIAMGPTGEKGKRGEITWQYRLAKPPEGGPVLTETAIYQATINGGLHRIPKLPGDFKAWYAPRARRFLAEWPEGVVVLTYDEKLAVIRDNPNEPEVIADAHGYTAGISNVVNDAIFLTTRQGTIRCLRPANAPPLTLASFIPSVVKEMNHKVEEPETFRERMHREAIEQKIKSGKLPKPIEKPAAEDNAPTATVAAKPAPGVPETPPQPRDPLRSNIPVVK